MICLIELDGYIIALDRISYIEHGEPKKPSDPPPHLLLHFADRESLALHGKLADALLLCLRNHPQVHKVVSAVEP